MGARLAVVIPVLNERSVLRTLLERLADDTPAPEEVVVVSGKANPELREAFADGSVRYLETAPNRGLQLALGACVATADVLWFLHADSRPGPGASRALLDAIDTGAESGCFAFAFADADGWRPRLLAALTNARVGRGGTPYGDQGLFATREAYFACGGFALTPLFEEVTLVKKLRRRGTFRCLAEPIGVCPERWQRDGWLRRGFGNRWLALCHACGAAPEQLAKTYWPAARD